MNNANSSLLREAPQGFVFMKIGAHAGETLETIIERKQREIDVAGRTFWGYGGSACHPIKQVQPFARGLASKGAQVFLLMEYVHSVANPTIVPATSYSPDGQNWEPIPEGINVTGSKWAIVMSEIVPGELELPLDEFSIGIGPSLGKTGSDYLKGRTDKACLVRGVKAVPSGERPRIRKVSFIGKMVEPYGVLVR